MILKSEKRFYDEKEKKYKQPLCEFDTENLIVTDTDSSTGASTQNSFVSVYIRRIFHIYWSGILISFRNLSIKARYIRIC